MPQPTPAWRVWLPAAVLLALVLGPRGPLARAAGAAGDPPSGPAIPDSLVVAAQSRGSVRILVRLATSFTPEGDLAESQGEAAVAGQRARIRRSRQQLLESLPEGSVRVTRHFDSVPYVAMEATSEALWALQAGRRPGEVLPDRLYAPVLSQSAPLIGADDAWSAGIDGAGWTVAIVDTGVDRAHSFLAGRVVSEACYSAGGDCQNGSTSQVGTGAGIPCPWAPSGCRHGTHVAGIAAGRGSSFSGVARSAGLISVRVFSRFTGVDCLDQGEDPCALAFGSDIMAGIERVHAIRGSFQIAAVNLSLGGGEYASQAACDADEAPLKSVIDNLRAAGIATVVASGNEGFTGALSAPACISSAVSVGATSKADAVLSFSNSAPFLTLLAPGGSITSSVPGGGFASFSGTSMASPHVAGAFALRRQASPADSVSDVVAAMISTGEPILDPRNGLTRPRIRIDRIMFNCRAAAGSLLPFAGVPVDFTATGSLGTEPYLFTWDFDDGTPAAAGAMVSHTFAGAGDFDVSLTGMDDEGLACSSTVAVSVSGPEIRRVRSARRPAFSLKVSGRGFVAGAQVLIDGAPAPQTIQDGRTRLVALGGAALEAMIPAGVAVQITVQVPTGAVSAPVGFTR